MQVQENTRPLVGLDAIWTFLRDELGLQVGRTWVHEHLTDGTLPARLIAGKWHASPDRLKEWGGL
jgi:hypothetical protein